MSLLREIFVLFGALLIWSVRLFKGNFLDADFKRPAAASLNVPGHLQMRTTQLTILLIALVSCADTKDKWDIRGSWYLNYTDWEPLDSAHNYVEMYITDTTLYGQDEMSGQSADHKYRVMSDSIFFEESKMKLVPLYKILSYKQDTLRLLVNKKYFKKLDTVFWVRFSKEEFGHYDLKWTSENADSLNQKLAVDWNRR
jgi:hypothetical protein